MGEGRIALNEQKKIIIITKSLVTPVARNAKLRRKRDEIATVAHTSQAA